MRVRVEDSLYKSSMKLATIKSSPQPMSHSRLQTLKFSEESMYESYLIEGIYWVDAHDR